jgi:hypothetical protein
MQINKPLNLIEKCLKLDHDHFVAYPFQFRVYCLIIDAECGQVRAMESVVNEAADPHDKHSVCVGDSSTNNISVVR